MILIIDICIFLLIFILMYVLVSELREKNKIKDINNYLRKIKEGYFSYERIEKYLKGIGAPEGLTPMSYLFGKFLIAAIMLIFCAAAGMYVRGVILALLGFFMLDLILLYKNKKDMKKINFELKNVYDLLDIQAAAGVFIGKTLSEAYLVVSNKRLKKALAILSAEISIKKDIVKALDNFNSKFKSADIVNFVQLIEQSLETGQSKSEISDMSNVISETNFIEIKQYSKKIDDTATKIELLIFLGILLTALYFIWGQINFAGLFK